MPTVSKPKLSSSEKLIYSIIGYQNSIHSPPKLKPIDLLLGYLELKEPIEIDIEVQPINHAIS